MSNSKKEYERMFRQFTNPYSLRNLASEYIIGGGMEWVKNKFGIEFNLTSAEFDKAFKWIEKYDKKFDKHVSNPQSLLDRNKDNKSIPSQRYIIDKKFVCKIEKDTFFYVNAGPSRYEGAGNGDNRNQEQQPKFLYIYIFGKHMLKYARRLAHEINDTGSKYLTNYKVSGTGGGYGRDDKDALYFNVMSSDLHTRPLETLFFDDNVAEQITNHLDKFLSNEPVYKDRSLLYKTGILLYGAPGTGKSSLVTAIATYYNYDVVSIDMASFATLDVNALVESINADKEKYVVLMEDIDAVVKSRDRKDSDKEDKKIINKLLQFLDSTSSPTNVIFVATTNYVDNLDEAVKRDGRFDLRVEVKELSAKRIDAMCKSFDLNQKDIEDIRDTVVNKLGLQTINQSRLQNLILKKIENKSDIPEDTQIKEEPKEEVAQDVEVSEAIDNDEDHVLVLNKLHNNAVSVVDEMQQAAFEARAYNAHNKIMTSSIIEDRLERIENALFNNESEATDTTDKE